GPGCVIRGTSPMPKGTAIYDAPTGGRLIATFTGGFAPMSISDIPPDPATQRSKLSTHANEPSVRIDGYVDTSVIPIYSSRDIPIVANSIWIASAQKLKMTGAAQGVVNVEMGILGTNGQIVKATTPCDSIALQRGTPTPLPVPGDGRGFLARATNIDIFDSPGGSPIFTLKMSAADVKLFWSTETTPVFVHGKLRADVAIDGWIRRNDLSALPKGEMLDQYIPPETTVAGAQLVLETPPRIARAPKDIPIRFRRTEAEYPIGAVEAGAEFYVFETLAGWTNVLPTKAYVLPSETNGFWVPAKDVPAP
ncbi:MAG TPA: hypothetical protein PK156_49665, partial [Polyangium sp.]|nr:hypothetical protein [Polyangium sp.]